MLPLLSEFFNLLKVEFSFDFSFNFSSFFDFSNDIKAGAVPVPFVRHGNGNLDFFFLLSKLANLSRLEDRGIVDGFIGELTGLREPTSVTLISGVTLLRIVGASPTLLVLFIDVRGCNKKHQF